MMRLSLSPGPAANTALVAWQGDMDALAGLVGTPKPGRKDGSYFVRGPFDGTAKRSDANITRAFVAILDGDKRIDPGSGELFEGAPSPEIVHDALSDAGVSHVLFSSYSHHDPARGGPGFARWRCVVPVELANAEELRAVVDHLIAELHRRHVMLAPAVENYRWAQAWFLPRLRSSDAPFVFLRFDDGDPLDVAAIVARHRQDRPEIEAEPRPARQTGTGPISRFIADHGDPARIIDRLEAHGYVLRATATVNGEAAYRLIRAGSTTGTPGVAVFRHLEGTKWLISSHHGDDPLALRGPDGRALAHDAFDVFRILEHGGDEQAALAALRPADPAPPPWLDDAPPLADERGQAVGDTTERRERAAPLEFSAQDLVAMHFSPVRWAVAGILPEGVCLLVGAPKIGKSWLALDLALAVGSGGLLMGQAEVGQGEALYLALEDNPRRLQRRILARLGTEPAPAGVFFRTDWKPINHGGVEDLRAWLGHHPAARVVIIDTLARFRPSVSTNLSAYEQDYQVGSVLTRLAADHGVAVVLVHHDRKMAADDVLQTVSGTQGLTGGVDNILILRRNRFTKQAELHVTGRDIEDEQVYALEFQDCRWIIKGAGAGALLGAEKKRIVELIRQHGPVGGA